MSTQQLTEGTLPPVDGEAGDREVAAKLKERREARKAEKPAPSATPDTLKAKSPAPKKEAPNKDSPKGEQPKPEPKKLQKPNADEPSLVKGDQPDDQPKKEPAVSPSAENLDPESPESEQDEPEVEHEDEPERTIKVLNAEGKEEELPESEVARGYMRQADYTRKTQELQQHRQGILQEQQQFTQVRDATLSELEVLSQRLVSELTNQGKNGNLEQLRMTDPAEYAARVADVERQRGLLREALQKSNAMRAMAVQQAQQVAQRQLQAATQEGTRRLVMAVPELADAAKLRGFKRDLHQFLRAHGYQDQELSGLTDHRSLLIAREAMLYRKSQDVRKKVVLEKREPESKVKAPPQKAAGPTRQDSVQAKIESQAARLKKTGSTDDVAAMLKLRRQANQRR